MTAFVFQGHNLIQLLCGITSLHWILSRHRPALTQLCKDALCLVPQKLKQTENTHDRSSFWRLSRWCVSVGSGSSGLHPAVPLPFKTPAFFHGSRSGVKCASRASALHDSRVWRIYVSGSCALSMMRSIWTISLFSVHFLSSDVKAERCHSPLLHHKACSVIQCRVPSTVTWQMHITVEKQTQSCTFPLGLPFSLVCSIISSPHREAAKSKTIHSVCCGNSPFVFSHYLTL